jgi:hypothetical protein
VPCSESFSTSGFISQNNNATMGSSEMNIESKNKEVSSSPGNDGGSAVPSGFILKLYQMVNGAPDEVIKVRKVPSKLIEAHYAICKGRMFFGRLGLPHSSFQKELSLHMTFNGRHMEVKSDIRSNEILPQRSSICSSLGLRWVQTKVSKNFEPSFDRISMHYSMVGKEHTGPHRPRPAECGRVCVHSLQT